MPASSQEKKNKQATRLLFLLKLMKYINWNVSPKVTAFTTTREIGNMAYQVGNEDKKAILANRRKLLDRIDDIHHLIFVHQTHSDVILEATHKDLGRGEYSYESGMESDALYTKENNIALGIFHADCVPIFFYIPKHHIVGIIHSGHKGTKKEILYKSFKYIMEKENVIPEEIKIYIGPCRQEKDYLIDEVEAKSIVDLGYEEAVINHEDGPHFDMVKMNLKMIKNLQIPLKNVKISTKNTVTNKNLYSAYKNHPVGRMASIIMLNK